MANLPDDIKLVPGPAEKRLNQRQLLDYETHREDYLEWLYHLGKSPEQAQGYSQSTVKRDAYRVDQFYRWIWSQEDGYATSCYSHARGRLHRPLSVRRQQQLPQIQMPQSTETALQMAAPPARSRPLEPETQLLLGTHTAPELRRDRNYEEAK